MKKLIETVSKHPLITGSAVIFVGTLFANFFNFLFNIFMSRNLSASDYGTLVSLIALFGLSTQPAGSILPAVVNFAAKYFASRDVEKAKGLFYKVIKPLAVIALIGFVIFSIFSSVIAAFFHIANDTLVVLIGICVFVGVIGIVNLGLLQGKLLFKFISMMNLLSTGAKYLFGILFVSMGFAVTGAVWAIVLSLIIGFVISFKPLGFLINRQIKTNDEVQLRHLFTYGMPAAIAMFCLTSLISTDLLLIKHFYSPDQAGIYAAGLSLVGRVIFFLTAPIATVMFPMAVQRYTKGEDYHELLRLSLLLVFLPSVAMTIFYFLFPEFTIAFFTKGKYISVAPLLGIFAIFISVYSLLAVLTQFLLSINKTNIAWILAIGALCQAIGIWLYHDSFVTVIIVSLIITSLLLIALLLYYWNLIRYEKKK